MSTMSIRDTTKLQLHLYTLGYCPMGESILVILWDAEDGKVLKSIFIDCFEKDRVNRMESILEKYNIDKNKLDFIVWTHPDYDHSVGLNKIIEKYTSKSTKLLIPTGLTKGIFALRSVKLIKSWLAALYMAKKKNVECVGTSKETRYPIIYGYTKYCDAIHKDVEFEIEILTPFTNFAFAKIGRNKTHKGNDISISLMVRVAGQNFYFGGDTENDVIERLEEERMCNVVFIKIPHHGSQTSDYLPGLFSRIRERENMDEATSITTSFKRGKIDLPDMKVIDRYKEISTQILLTKSEKTTNDYGMYKLIYNLNQRDFVEVAPYGDAFKYYP